MKKPITLPLNCSAIYVEEFISEEKATQLYEKLYTEYEISKQRLKITVSDKITYSDTGKIMFLDEELHQRNLFPEEVWGTTAIWFDDLYEIKKSVEAFTGLQFGVCVCIYYPNGNSGVSYHSDFTAFGDTTTIPSLSLGAERIFYLKEKENLKVYETLLQNGSMLVMGEHCQERYEHSLPVNPMYTKGRINLTFRQYGFPEK